MSTRRRIRTGFSLIELLVASAIAFIVLGVGVPGFRSLLQKQRMTATANDLLAAMLLTRSEAIQRGSRVDLVPIDGRNWTSGWVVYVDENDNHRPDKSDCIVFSHGAIPAGIAITAALSDSSDQYLAYNGAGHTRTNAGSQSPQFGTWSFSQDGKVKRRIKIDFLGRPRICDPDVDSACTGTADSK